MGNIRLKPTAVIIVFSLFIGLLVSVLDILLHMSGFQGFRILNLFVYAVFAFTIYWTSKNYRDMFRGGYISYWGAFKNCFLIGFWAAVIIGAARYLFLVYFQEINIESILQQAEEEMLMSYPWLTNNQVDQKLAYLEYSYKPLVSAALYFFIYMGWSVLFSFLAAIYVKRIDRNISDIIE